MRRARLSDGTAPDVNVSVIALGAVGNVDWLIGASLPRTSTA
jgi:hypothetical protein